MTKGMVSISRRDPSSRVPSQANSYEKRSASLSTPEKTPSFKCTTSTSKPPRLSDSSMIWSIMLIAIESSCIVRLSLPSMRILQSLHRPDLQIPLQIRSHCNCHCDCEQTDYTKKYLCHN